MPGAHHRRELRAAARAEAAKPKKRPMLPPPLATSTEAKEREPEIQDPGYPSAPERIEQRPWQTNTPRRNSGGYGSSSREAPTTKHKKS